MGRRGTLRRAWPGLGLLLLLGLAACQPTPSKDTMTTPPSRPLAEVLAAHTPGLMAIPGVVGTAESVTADGGPCVLIMVDRLTPDLRRRLPARLEGWPVRIEETGEIRAMPDSGP